MSGYFDALNRRRRDPAGPGTAPAPAPVERPPVIVSVPRADVRVEAEERRPRLRAPVYEPPAIRPVVPAPYEALREKLVVAANGTPLKTIVFAGCRGGEGCTSVVRELAQVLAASGLDVLVVDGDRGGDAAPDSAALGPDLVEAVQTGGMPEATECGTGRITVVPRRTAIPDKEHFYRAPEFAAWIAAQRNRCDYVLLDALPVLAFADATLLARVSDAAVIVAQAGVTERDTLVRASEQLERAGAKVVGVVLNGARESVPGFLQPYLKNA